MLYNEQVPTHTNYTRYKYELWNHCIINIVTTCIVHVAKQTLLLWQHAVIGTYYIFTSTDKYEWSMVYVQNETKIYQSNCKQLYGLMMCVTKYCLTTQIRSLMKCAYYFFINHFTVMNNVVSTIFSATKIWKMISQRNIILSVHIMCMYA